MQKTLALLTILTATSRAADPGLLFHLSGNSPQFSADTAASGDLLPSVSRGITVIPDGTKGPALQCANTQVLACRPGNIYTQRGTLSFFWRSTDPGTTSS